PPRAVDTPLDAALLLRQPVETGKDPGQRAGEIRHGVGHNSQAGIGEAPGIAVSVDDDSGALRGQRCQHTVEDRYSADLDTRLIAAAHSPGESAGEHQTKGRRITSR